MNQVIVYLVVLLTISSPVVFGAFDDIDEYFGDFEPTTSASTVASRTSTSTTRPTIATSSTSSSTTPHPSSSTTSNPNGFHLPNLSNLSNIFQGNNSLWPISSSNNAFQFPNPLQGFQNIGRIPNELVEQAVKQSLQPTISHFQGILKILITEPNRNDELISVLQRTIDSFKTLMTDAPNLGKAENVAIDIQTRKFIKQMSQPFDQFRNIFNLRL